MWKMDKKAFNSFLDVSLQDVVLRAESFHHEFWVHNLLYALLVPRCSIVARWSLPYEDEVKINVDVVGNAKTSFAYYDVVVHGHEGMVIVKLTFSIVEAFDAHSTEALSLFCATKKALEKSFSKVVLNMTALLLLISFIVRL
ncbi:hypothetical protein GOBAR_AA11883 [Gossypium barbadense]|uniref:Uncharacterized protein n=1 Tax=Gossypium barbadense TaxID=3634 RepID=A0A2P5XZH6_GOSBA|nr:hypothetical protein GOBAR_AA11883 [Gossypium barbadense]